MNEIIISMFEAGNGDSFLVSFIGENRTNILIDFGYSNTYKKYVESHLKDMAGKNEKIDLVIVTHIDQDHISGGIRFFEENGFADSPKIISVGEVWHNSYRHLEMAETDKILTEKERTYITRNSIVVEKNRDGNTQDTSGKQGSRLAANLRHYKYSWNTSFNNQAISYKGNKPICFNKELKITVLSPTTTELDDLKKTWRKELKVKFPTIELNNDTIFDDAIECISLMRQPRNFTNSPKDTSETYNIEDLASSVLSEDTDEINASSITCIFEFMGRRLLFLGDTKSSIIEEQIKKIYKKEDFPIKFDGIKVSHHGSSKNTRKELLELIDSEHYFISTNGSMHNHPDIETIAKIITSKSRGVTRNLYFSNRLSKLNIFENVEWQGKYQYKLHYRESSENSLNIHL